jgi:hypothetical protein
MDNPFIENDEQPHPHNPIQYLPWLDTRAEHAVFQLRPTLENRLAEWCGGTVAVENGQLVVQIPGSPPVTARLGDFVIHDGERYRVESPDGFNTRYWPVGRDPGWSHRCHQRWEGSADGRDG